MGVHAGVVCRLGVLGKGIGGERDDGDIGCIDLLAQTDRAGCLIAVHVRHHNVHQDRIEAAGRINRMRDEYNMRRRLVVKSFNQMGLTCFEPRGAFYAFPCIKSTGMSSQEFCTKLLEQKHVAIIPGDAFGASGEGYARVSYAYSVEHLKEALKRIKEFLQENGIYHGEA